jgi:DNA polymerase elongation subunit (family B)
MTEQTILNDILFIDIETVSSVANYSKLDNRFKDLWAKKMRWQTEKENKTPKELYGKAAIWAEFGKIVCISAGYIIEDKKGNKKFRLKSFYGHKEKGILLNFAKLLNTHFNGKNHLLCAHNGKEFDFPYIARRMLIHGIRLPAILDLSGKKSWEVKHIDTLEMWKFGDYKHYTSLDLLAALFNIPSPKEQIDGSMVNHIYWEENNLEKIAEYCQRDVITICKLYMKFKLLPYADNLIVDIVKASVSS